MPINKRKKNLKTVFNKKPIHKKSTLDDYLDSDKFILNCRYN